MPTQPITAVFWAAVGAMALLAFNAIHDAWVQEGAKATFYSERTPPPKDPQYKVRTFEFHPEGAPDALCVVQLDGFRSISCFRTR